MKKGKWIRIGLLAAVGCGGLVSAHAQASTLRQQQRVAVQTTNMRKAQKLEVADAVWNYFTGLLRQAVDKAIQGPEPPKAQLAINDHFFDMQ